MQGRFYDFFVGTGVGVRRFATQLRETRRGSRIWALTANNAPGFEDLRAECRGRARVRTLGFIGILSRTLGLVRLGFEGTGSCDIPDPTTSKNRPCIFYVAVLFNFMLQRAFFCQVSYSWFCGGSVCAKPED